VRQIACLTLNPQPSTLTLVTPEPEDQPKPSRKPILIIAGVILALIAIGIIGVEMSSTSESGDSDPGPTSVTDMNIVIGIRNYNYNPRIISIPLGATVTWLNDDKVDHTATEKNGVWDSTIIHSEESQTLQFDTPGTYNYYCTIHPYMTGTLTVRRDGTPTQSTTTTSRTPTQPSP
jgi:plastocyanin